jgi:hypothetical protein
MASPLKQRLQHSRPQLSEPHAIRLHRAISWLDAAERYQDDADVSFISLWIAFNSCYAIEGLAGQLAERESFRLFIQQLNRADVHRSLYERLWARYSQFIRTLIDNQYVYGPFWEAQRESNPDWARGFAASKRRAHQALVDQDMPSLLMVVLDRLYVLRNQLMHGGATYASSVNRQQVQDGQRFMQDFVPLMVALMLDNPQLDWGPVHYPVVA